MFARFPFPLLTLVGLAVGGFVVLVVKVVGAGC